MRRIERQIDPRGIAQGIREQRLGSIPERDLAREQERQNRYEWQTPLILTATLGPWYRENPGASLTAGGMRLLNLGTSSTNEAVANLIYNTNTGAPITMHQAGRVVGGGLASSTTITAGSIVLGVDAAGAVTYLSDAVLNTTYPARHHYWIGWNNGITFAANETIRPVLTTDAGFLPVTADISAWLVIAWQEPQ